MIRVGNDHIAVHRAAKIPWDRYIGAQLAGGVLLYWLAAWATRRAGPREEDIHL